MADNDIQNIGSGKTPTHDEKWERVIENILSKWVSSFHVGIYGIKFCQVCGQLKTYDGWCVAKATHAPVNGKLEFVCLKCIGDSPAGTQSGHDLGKFCAYAKAVLGTRPFRYCDICGLRTEIAVQEKYDVKTWVCSACEPKAASKDFVSRLERRRYVEHRCTTYDQLCAFDIQLETHKLDLEETLNTELQAQRSARLKAALRVLERIHEKEYVQLLADEES